MKIIKLFIILTLFITSLFSNDKKLKIIISPDMIPYSFVDENKVPRGIFVDYWKLWAKKNNQSIEFVPMSWKDGMKALREKKMDIHSGLFKNKQRERFTEYLSAIYPSQVNFYINSDEKKKITSLSSLDGKTIGVLKGTYFETYVKQNFPQLKVKKFTSFTEQFNAIRKKDIDVFIDDSLIAWSQLINDFSFNRVSILEGFELNTWFFAGVKKGDEELKNIVLDGMKKISIEDLIKIEKKWIIEQSLRYFEKRIDLDKLTFEERLWLLQNPNASFALVKAWQRYSFFDVDKKFKGFHVDLIKLINKSLNTNIKYKIYNSWADAYGSVIKGDTEAILGLSWSKKREEFFEYSPSYHYSPYYMIARKGDQSIKELEDFNTKTAVTYENSITNNIIKEKAPNTKFIHRNNIPDLLKAISLRQADSAIIENAKSMDLEKYGLKIVDSVFTKYGEVSIGTSKNKKIFASIAKKAIKSLPHKELEEIKNKWFNEKVIFSTDELSYIKNSPVLKVGIEDWSAVIGTEDGKNIEGVGGELAVKAFEISGLKFEYIKGNWDELLQQFKDKKIDILPTTIYTKQRAQYGEFSKKYLSIKNYIYVRSNNTDIKSLKDLNFRKIAIQKDFGTINLIRDIYPDIEIIETKNLEDSMQRVLNGEVDALFELQLSVEKKMKELLITNLKSVSQNSIKSQGLHVFTKKDDLLLKSIIDKSLESIPDDDKNKIISKWIKTFEIKKDLNIAFGLGRDPYVLNKEYIKGIEYDLVKKILDMSSLKIRNTLNISLEKLDNILNVDSSIDIAVSVKEKINDDLFYSKTFIEFENVVVSRKEDKLEIDKIDDLGGKSIISFFEAYKYLGDKYNKMFNKKVKPLNYKEESFQEKQIEAFLNKEVDVIILDKNIFKWFFNKLSQKNINDYVIHSIFPKNNSYKVAFRDKNLRDIFDKNLEIIKQTGEYKQVVLDYTQGYIESKVKINSLISSVVSNFIFTDETTQLNKIIEVFSRQPYIDKIEVYDIQDKLVSSTSDLRLKRFSLQDSYYFMVNVPQKVGYIKVYFDEALLEVYEDSNSFIPKVELFENLKGYEYIRQIYKNFGYLNNRLDFTKKEKEFIKNKKVITFSEINWQPLTIIENGQFTGLFKDYLDIIEKQTGLVFKFVESKDWKDVMTKYKRKEIDIIPALGDIAFTFGNSYVSNPITSFKYAIVTNKEGSFLDGLKDLENKTLALPKNYSSSLLIKNNFPNIKVVETNDVKEALSLVSKNKVDAFVGHSAISVYNIQNVFPDLKIVGLSEEKFNHYVLIQDKYPELNSIINKVLFNISSKQKQDIKNKWIHTEVSTAVDYSIVYRIVIVFTVILIIVLIFTKKLSRAKKEVEEASNKMKDTLTTLMVTKEELLEKTKDLEEQRDVFETLFNETSDGLSLIKDGKFISCNGAVLKMLKYKTEEEFINLSPEQLSPEYQPDGQKSVDKVKKMTEICLEKGTNRFEWVHKKSTGELFWAEIVLTKIVLNHEVVVHAVWRDIEDKKVLEEQNYNRTIELEDTNNELEVSIENLKQTQNQLIESEKMASLGGLVAGVAHEINTPIGIGLTGVTHFDEITKDLKESYEKDVMTQEEFEDYLKTSTDLSNLIHSNLNRAANLVKSFKQVAVDQTSEEKREFNLHDYIDEILSSIHSVTKKTKLDIKIDCDRSIKIYSYPGAISQILTNFIMNSIIHGYEKDEKGTINIDILKQGDEVKIIYKDDGRGIPSDNLSKVFEPFFTTNREKGGSGLGLNIIYNIVTTKLNGKIICENNPKGVEFIIIFNV